MGQLRSEYHLAGLVVPLPDAQDYETANDAQTLNSAYTESGPQPGLPVSSEELSTLVPVVSGAQDGDLVLTVMQGGSPGIRNDSLQLGYRYASDASLLYDRGWTAPNGFDDWDDVVWSSTSTSDFIDAVTHPNDQRVLVAHADTVSGIVSIRRWRPDTATWSSLGVIAGASAISTAMCVLSTGMVLCLAYGGPMSRSGDFGSTWVDHSDDTGMPQLEGPRMVEVDGELLLVGFSPGSTTLEQYASSNSGASFTLVESISNFGSKLSVCKLPDGRIVLVYRRNADGFPCSRIIGSPWDPISGASSTTAELKAASIVDVVACADDDGLLWAYATLTAAPHAMYAFRSQNLGTSWGEFTFGAALVSTSGTDSLRPLKAVSTQGQVMVLSKFVASTGTLDQSIVSLRFGGWSSAPYSLIGGATGILNRVGFGPHATLTPIVYLPIETPTNNGWSGTGVGVESLVSGRCNIVTAANTRYFGWGPGMSTTLLVRAGLRVISGGMLTQRDIGLTCAVANNVVEYRLDIRFTTSGFRVCDPHGAAGAGTTIADVLYDCTAEMDILVYVTGSLLGAYVLYKRPYESAWQYVVSGITLTLAAAPAATGIVDWGHIANGTAQSEWRYVASCETGVTSWPSEINVSRPISTIPVPMHCETESDGIVGRLSAIGGSGARGETFEVDAEYEYPAEAAYPQVSPSPSAPWRTTNKEQQRRALLLDFAQTLGEPHPAIIALGCNFRTALLQYESSGWNTIVTLDLAQGFAGINYVRTGSMLMAGAGGVAPGRFLRKNELAGGYAVIETAGGTSTIARRIAGNESGWWSSSASTKQARVYLEGVTGTEDASGQCDLVWRHGVALNYQASLTLASRWRLLIPADQVTPDDYYEAGILVPGALHVPGAPPDWGYSEELVPNVTSRKTPAGVSYLRQLGLPTRKLVFGWSGGTDQAELRRSATDGDYVGIAGQLPMAAFEDVAAWCEAMQAYMRSGEIPGLWLKSLPSSDSTVTDPSLLTWGRLMSSVGHDHESGDEDSGEVVRPIAWTIEGIP